jgi:hypothetical protein
MFTWTINLHSVVPVPILLTVALPFSVNFETLGIAVVCGALALFIAISVSNFSFAFPLEQTISVSRLPLSFSISVTTEIRIVERPSTGWDTRDGVWWTRRTRWADSAGSYSGWLCSIGGKALPSSEQFSTKATNFIFVVAPNFSVLKFKFVERLADDIEFVDLRGDCTTKDME